MDLLLSFDHASSHCPLVCIDFDRLLFVLRIIRRVSLALHHLQLLFVLNQKRKRIIQSSVGISFRPPPQLLQHPFPKPHVQNVSPSHACAHHFFSFMPTRPGLLFAYGLRA